MSDPFRPLTSETEWTEALEASSESPVLVFKHSSACPVSAQANEEMSALAADAEVPVYKVVVQNHRAVSDAVEADLEVRHETPQAIVLRNRQPAFHTSHFDVTAETIREQLSNPTTR